MSNKIEYSYYSLFLKNHLQDIDDERQDNVEFISSYAERAEREYEECRRNGQTVFQAQESAMSVLMSGIPEN